MSRAIFLAHIAVTCGVAGAMWFIQIVHYPLMRYVGRSTFADYERVHTRLTVSLVVSLMAVEWLTGFGLLWWRVAGVPLVYVWLGLGSLSIVWLSTLFLQVPQHHALAAGFDELALQRLVKTNWIRTACYTGRLLLMLSMVNKAISGR